MRSPWPLFHSKALRDQYYLKLNRKGFDVEPVDLHDICICPWYVVDHPDRGDFSQNTPKRYFLHLFTVRERSTLKRNIFEKGFAKPGNVSYIEDGA